jgi:hypothetical protein
MESDIVERLDNWRLDAFGEALDTACLIKEAKDEIKQLRERVSYLEETFGLKESANG